MNRKRETAAEAYERTRRWLNASEDPQTPVCECAKQERCSACDPPAPAHTEEKGEGRG